MHIEQKNLEQKNDKLQEQYRAKAKSHAHYETLYKKLKRQQVTGGLELAAEHDAEDVLQTAGQRGPSIHSRAGSGHSGNSGGRHHSGRIEAFEQQFYGGERGGAQPNRRSMDTRVTLLNVTDSKQGVHRKSQVRHQTIALAFLRTQVARSITQSELMVSATPRRHVRRSRIWTRTSTAITTHMGTLA